VQLAGDLISQDHNPALPSLLSKPHTCLCRPLDSLAPYTAGGFSWQELGLLAATMALATAPAGA